MTTFEKFLEERFIDQREFCGRAITKDNCEDMFVPWLEDLDPQEFINLTEEYKSDYIRGSIERFNAFCKENNTVDINIVTIEKLLLN